MDDHRGFRPPGEDDDEDGPRSVFADVPDVDPDDGPLLSFPMSQEPSSGFSFGLAEDGTGEDLASDDGAGEDFAGEDSISEDIHEESGPVMKFADTGGEPTGVLPHWSAPAGSPPMDPSATGIMPVIGSSELPEPIVPVDEPGVAFHTDDLFESAGEDRLDAWSNQAQEPIWQDSSANWEQAPATPELAPIGVYGDIERQAPQGPDTGSFDAPPRSSSGRNLPVAIASGLGLAGIFLGLLSISRPAFSVAFLVPLIVLVQAEFLTATRRAGYRPAHLFALISTLGLTLGAFWVGESVYPIVLGLTVMFGMGWYLMDPLQRPLVNLALTLTSIMWIGFLGSFAMLMLKHPDGKGLLLAAVLTAVSYDIAGYFVGRSAGRARLAPNVSPNKTWEGLIGGVLAAVVMAIALTIVNGGLTPWTKLSDGIVLAIAVGIAAPIGDLAQSLIKRDLGIKDMGSIMPGHGGLLDRLDSLLFVLPTVYYVARFVDII